MDGSFDSRIKALEMINTLLFSALADMSPADARRLIDRLGQWLPATDAAGQAMIQRLLVEWDGYLRQRWPQEPAP